MKLGLYLLAALLLVSCGKQETTNNNSSVISELTLSKSSSPISGQVFVVTQGKENIKLALVEISAISEKDIIQYLNAKHSNGLEQQKGLMPDLDSAKKAAFLASNALNRAEKEYELVFDRMGVAATKDHEEFNNLVEVERQLADKKSKLSDTADLKSNAYRKMKSKFDYFDSAEYYFEKLPTPISIGKTDADGKFTLSLPAGKYVIAATSSRKVFKDTESYHWLVWVDTSSPNQSLMLSNDNLFETKCKECVQP